MASDSLYNYNLTPGALHVTVARASRFATDVTLGPQDDLWRPAADSGELRFRFLLTPETDSVRLARLACELERPPVAQTVPPSPGDLPRVGSVAALEPEALALLALKPAADGGAWILRAQNLADRPSDAALTWLGTQVALGTVRAHEIATWRLKLIENAWIAARVLAGEETSHEAQ